VTEPRTLVLLRHGRTSWNHTGRAQGHADVPLDEVGHAQAAAVAPHVAALQPARLWSSDLERAVQTAVHLAEATGLPVETDRRLREFSVGERQGLTWAESVARFPQIADGVGLGERLRGVPGAESDEDVAARLLPALHGCLAALEAGETGVVVGHGAALKLAVVGLIGWPLEQAKSLAVLGNCRWATITSATTTVEGTPSGSQGWRLQTYGAGDFASGQAIG
jgi:glucosyl-3-phosphoglycerate phosphatase